MFTRRMVDQILPSTVWPIAVLIAAVLLEAGPIHVGVDDLDEGYFAQQATRVLHGQVPFRDFATLYTPGLDYLHAALFALVGGPSLIAIRALSLATRAALVLSLFTLAKPLVRNPWWAAAPGLVLLLGLDDAPLRWEPHPGWLSTTFAVLAAWCFSHRLTRRWLIFGGVAAAASYAFKQNTGVLILGALVLWAGWRRAPTVIGAFGVVTLSWLTPLVIATGHPETLGALVGAVNQAGLFALPEPTLLIPTAALVGGVWLLRRDSHPLLRWYVLAGIALFGTEFPRMDTLHLVWSAPILLVLGALALERLGPVVAAAALVGSMALLAPTWSDRLAYLAEPRAAVDAANVEAPTQTATDLSDLVADIRSRTQPAEPIFVYPTSPLLYVLADRPNPTRFDHLNPGAATPDQLDGVIADLQRAGVRLVVVSDFWEQAWGPPGANAMLEDWLAAHYSEIARHGAYRVLVASL